MQDFTCDNCGDTFQAYLSSKKGKYKFCTKRCAEIFMIGDKNPNYRDGKHVDPRCVCGREKDYRSNKCSLCSGVGFPVGWTNEENPDITAAILDCRSVAEASRRLETSRNTISRYIELHKIDVSHMVRTGKTKGWRAQGDRFEADAKEFLVKRHTGARSALPRRIILRDNLIPYVCVECTQGPEWNGKELTLELDHINGDKLDDRLENFRFLCPNCHSQTDTFKGKNSKGTAKSKKGVK